MKLTYGEIKSLFPNHTLTQADDEVVVGFSRDSRQIKPGEIFVAIKGENFDGHDYVQSVMGRGAAAVLVDRDVGLDQGVIKVLDVTAALGTLAHFYRNKFSQPLIAITGSSGKTTTKELLVHVLGTKGSVIATRGNLNNQWGVPFTIFEFNDTAAFFIVEMGMNHFGEIRSLARMTRPTAALITTVGHAHLEGVGTIEGVAKAKGELFEELIPNDVAFVFGDDPLIAQLPTRARRIEYGFDDAREVRATDVRVAGETSRFTIICGNERKPATLPLAGRHHVQNALAVVSIALHHGLTLEQIVERLSTFSMAINRGKKIHWQGSVIIDDTYNANPDSMRAMIQTVRDVYPELRPLAVLGGMRELGPGAPQFHHEVGQFCLKVGIQELFVYGAHAEEYLKGFGLPDDQVFSHLFASHAALAKALRDFLSKKGPCVVLVKGSRGMTMEKVLKELGIE